MLAAVLTGIVVAGCGSSGIMAPIGPPVKVHEPPSRIYVVQPGDTLYSIAWRYGTDYRDLAAWNHIPSPYTIYPTQRLTLSPAAAPGRRAAGKRTSNSARSSAAEREAKSRTSRESRDAQHASGSALAPADTSVARASGAAGSSSHAGARDVSPQWRWPARGDVIKRFNEDGNKGIDIAGKLGEPVVAAAGGEVVYSGGGLIGYGELIIIKHNHSYLSAYAHNNKLLVKEGDRVSGGQTIAQMGHSGSDRVMLHFEIRRDGKPVDPLPFLSR